MARLTGLNVLVTGLTAEVAHAVIGRLIAEGASVIAAGVDASVDGPRVRFRTDVPVEPSGWQAVVDDVVEVEGALHGLVVGAPEWHRGPFLGEDPAAMQAMLDRNLFVPMVGVQTTAPLLARSGGGSVVLLASTLALGGGSGAAVMAATHQGLRGLGRALARELGDLGIRVNTVCPGENFGAPGDDELRANPALADQGVPRRVTPGDVAATVAFLLSDDSATCTGGEYRVDGGASA